MSNASWMNKSLAACCAGLASLTTFGFLVCESSRADWSSTSTTQLVLTVNAAKGTAKAVSNNFAVSGSGLAQPATPLNAAGAAAPNANLSFAPSAAGAAFNLNMETKTADTLATVDIDNGVLPAYSDISVDTDGTAGTLAGTVAAPTRGTATAGGPGSSATLVQSNVYSVFD